MTPPRSKSTAALTAVQDTEPKTYPATKTLGEVMDSMTGYDEIGIEANLHRPIEVLSDDDNPQHNSILLNRACIAVYRQHECGDSPAAAWKFAMEMRMADSMDYFPPKSLDEEMGLEDSSDAGKDEPPPATAPATKPGSVS